MVSKKAVNTLLASAVALTVVAGIGAANAMDEGTEKCFGVVKAGHNDCGNADKTHSCAGQAAEDGAGNEWIALPTGICEKLIGGSLEPTSGSADDVMHDEDMHEDNMHDEHEGEGH